jgi:endonuclease III
MNKKERAKHILKILQKLYPDPQAELDYNHDYEFLFAVIMSAQTTDKQVNKLTSKLFLKYNTLDSFANSNIIELEKDMSSIGLYKAKALNIKTTASILIYLHNSKVPNTPQELLNLPGVGRKTANVVLGDYFKLNHGIAVDTHVKRLSKNFGLSKQTNPDKIEEDLKKLFPKTEWSKMSLRMILYGRYYYPAHKANDTGPLQEYVVYKNKK